ncbi:hypothetical protein BJX63DRAFT_394777, partial [Aspergillus granulosus]
MTKTTARPQVHGLHLPGFWEYILLRQHRRHPRSSRETLGMTLPSSIITYYVLVYNNSISAARGVSREDIKVHRSWSGFEADRAGPSLARRQKPKLL